MTPACGNCKHLSSRERCTAPVPAWVVEYSPDWLLIHDRETCSQRDPSDPVDCGAFQAKP